MTKDEVRYKLKIKRRYFQNIVRQEADRVLVETFLSAFGDRDSFLLYSSIGDEARTDILIDELLSQGKKVYLPRVEGDKMVAVPYGDLRRGAFGISEPEGEAFYGAIDIVVTPLLGINPRGFRLGYGKGYYDRFLEMHGFFAVGYGYDFQRESFDEDEWDKPVRAFVSEKGVYYFDGKRGEDQF